MRSMELLSYSSRMFGKLCFTKTPRNSTSVPLHIGRFASTSTNTKKKAAPNSAHEEETDRNEKLYSSDKETHFGFETVSEEIKAQKVRAVFENVADRYDLMNDCMSVGIHRLWKDMFVDRVRPGKTTKLIDVAGGTGDIAFRFLKHITIKPEESTSIFPSFLPQNFPFNRNSAKQSQQPLKNNSFENYETKSSRRPSSAQDEELEESERSVLICDINPRMLEVGQKRALTMLSPSQQARTKWLEGDAENLSSIPDNSFDVYTIAFGIRNCVHVDRVLEEAYRVLKPGGRFMCLEFSHVNSSLIKWFYDQYSFQVIPVMGQVIAGEWDSYLYLVQSIRKFPNQEDFKSMIKDAGFRFVKYENLSLGVACIHSGFKLSDY